MKRFLDSLAYFFMSGFRDGIETDYKRTMYAKREIPDSSCPAYVENILYASGAISPGATREEEAVFATVLERLDAAAEKYTSLAATAPASHRETRHEKLMRLGIRDGEWCRVDTENRFSFRGRDYIISDQAAGYRAVRTEYGDYYPMDRVLAAGGRFYDMNIEEVEVILL